MPGTIPRKRLTEAAHMAHNEKKERGLLLMDTTLEQEKKLNGATEQDLLRELLEQQKKSTRRGWITVGVLAVLTAAMLVALAVLVPTLLRTLNQAYDTLKDTQTVVLQAKDTMDTVDSLAEQAQKSFGAVEDLSKQASASLSSIDTMVGNVDALVVENTQALSNAIEKLNTIDLEKLNQSIDDLNAVVTPLLKLFGRG